ncbi:crotonase [Bradymonadaceae bacterium TMQ3]|nr:crotonase [Bradymonadaceae bacterium TMQ3]TXC76521.1 crotonase [Bradymonadales bacterium TMQ1]
MAKAQNDVKIEVGQVARLTICRQARRNALSAGVIEGLIDGLKMLGDNTEVRAIVLTGEGERAFCAGGDLGDQLPEEGMLGMHRVRGQFAELILSMRRSPKPLIARVNGHALGGGFGLVLACDLAVAADHASFGTPEVKVGLFPMMISALIQRSLSQKHAMELMLTGDRIDAARALEMGVVNQVVAAAELDDAVGALAERVAAHSPAVVGLGRQAYYATEDMSLEQALRMLHSQLTINTLAEDAAEGISAFLEKRDPQWKGQ